MGSAGRMQPMEGGGEGCASSMCGGRGCGGSRPQDLADLLSDAGTVAAVRLVAHGKAWVQLGSPEQAQRALELLGRVGPRPWLSHLLPRMRLRGPPLGPPATR